MLLNLGLEEALEWERTRGQSPTDGTGFRCTTGTYEVGRAFLMKIGPPRTIHLALPCLSNVTGP